MSKPDGKAARPIRSISEREIAIALVLTLANHHNTGFSLLGVYDDDLDFLNALATKLQVTPDGSARMKFQKVCRKLVNRGVLYGRWVHCHKEYVGEPTKQYEYSFSDPGKARLLTQGPTMHIGSPEWEAEFLLRRVYPRED